MKLILRELRQFDYSEEYDQMMEYKKNQINKAAHFLLDPNKDRNKLMNEKWDEICSIYQSEDKRYDEFFFWEFNELDITNPIKYNPNEFYEFDNETFVSELQIPNNIDCELYTLICKIITSGCRFIVLEETFNGIDKIATYEII